MANSPDSLPRFNRLRRRHEATIRERRRSEILFKHNGTASMLTIYPDVAIVSEAKATVAVQLERLAGLMYRRSLLIPWFGLYRLAFVYLGDDLRSRKSASVIMSYRKLIEAISVLQSLASERKADLVIRKEPYPWVEMLALLAFVPISLGTAAARSGGIVGGLVFAIVLFLFLASIEVVVELRHRPPPSFPQT